MKSYRMNAVMAGVLYLLGTVFGVMSAIVGGEVLGSVVAAKPLVGVDMLGIVVANASQLTLGAFLILMMALSLVAMTIFLYPIFKKDSKELAVGMLLFRGALEGSYYFASVLGLLTLVALGNEYIASGATSAALQSMGNVLYQFQDFIGPVGTIMFLIGGYMSIHLLLPHPANPPLAVHLGPDRRGSLFGLCLVAFLSPGTWVWVLSSNGVGTAGTCHGSLAADQGLQSGCSQEIG